MKRALWEACNNNCDLVTTSLQNAFVAENLIPSSKVHRLFSDSQSNSTAAEIDKSVSEIDNQSTGLVADSQSFMSAGHDPHHNANIVNSLDQVEYISEEALLKSREEHLQAFTAGPGKHLNDSFEEAKEALKSNKARQREIVSLLNEQKALIDEYTSYLSRLSDDASNSPESEIAMERLDAAKKSYRAAHHELQICKEQINETQSLKKRAMTAMLTAFNEYFNTFIMSPSHS
jgi:hypothetical protein